MQAYETALLKDYIFLDTGNECAVCRIIDPLCSEFFEIHKGGRVSLKGGCKTKDYLCKLKTADENQKMIFIRVILRVAAADCGKY